ncbi:unnamed protein product [Cylindrotheca closterium]|uniref:BTB domain-containing protein n=1 Tax=Cylindrotheca closterium TaxID=2856 RepID=A0AAD2JNB9_9STRA|nr:unnamed protein product [Cylindrotheca closterium]
MENINDENNNEINHNNHGLGAGAPWDQEEGNGNNIDMEMEDGNDRDANGDLDGGIAVNPDGASNSNRTTTECDLVLYLECEEEISAAPNHPIIRPGATVFIGMDKNTKLAAVFKRFVEFCNDRQKRRDHIEVSDLEFLHCQLLNGSDTAETSALMKNDRIKVRANKSIEREIEAERKRQQRIADAHFFDQMRILLPDKWNKYADIVLDCQGKLVDDKGRNQKVLWTKVKAYTPILQARCPWIYDIIMKAKTDALAAALAQDTALEFTPNVEDTKSVVARVESEMKAVDEDEDDNSIEVMPFNENDAQNAEIAASSGANEIENDDEEDLRFDGCAKVRSDSPVLSSRHRGQSEPLKKDLFKVTVQNHSPEAIKLLLEYCYTNRVVVLGLNAFIVACKERPTGEKGPIPPLPMTKAGHPRYAQDSRPLVSFQVALAGIELAEEANMPRLSLMCEVAAAQLVTSINVVRALSLCASQKSKSGNDLPKLRKAAMDVVLRNGSRGVLELGRTAMFRKALEEPRAIIVPTLLQGTTEAVTRYGKRGQSKRTKPNVSIYSFDELDREDAIKRERERRKRRIESGRAYEIEEYGNDPSLRWKASYDSSGSRKRPLKLMPATRGKTISRSDEHGSKSRRESGSHRRRAN